MTYYVTNDFNKNSYRNDAILLRDLCKSLVKNNSFISVYSNTSLTPVDIIKARQGMSDSKEVGNVFKNIMLNSMVGAFEGGNALRSFLTAYLSSLSCIDKNDWDISLSKISAKSVRSGEKQLDYLIQKFCDEESYQIYKKTFDISGSDSSISIEESAFLKTRIIQSDGFKLPFSLPYEFWKGISRKKIEFLNPKIILIDGTIITLGEVHGLLNQALKQDQPVLLFARGFGEEVIGTLIQNFQMGKLKVLPVILPLGPLSNIMYDISEITQTDVISTINGATLSGVELLDINSIKFTRADEQNIVLFLETPEYYNDLINKIRKEYKEATLRHSDFSDKIEKSYVERLKFLTNKRVEILLGKNSQSPPGILKDRLQTIFSVYNEVVETGIIYTKDIKNNIPDEVYTELCNCGIEYLPSATLCYALSAAQANQKLLKGVKKILSIDK